MEEKDRRWVGAVVAALLAAVALSAFLLLRGDEDYRVTARFLNASQLVDGNLVTVAGEPVGTVLDIDLTHDGQAAVELKIDEDYAPLRDGTRAVIRQRSLSGVANRYVELHLGGAGGGEIADGAEIPSVDTQANVDLDQLFNVFEPETRKDTQGTIRFLRDLNRGNEREAGTALRYLNPALSASSRLFAELNRSTPDLERFVTRTANLVTDLSARDDDLAGLVSNLATTFDALADERDDLGEGVENLPPFMRRANTTFVNLRAALDDLDPLVDAARPVVRDSLGPLMAQLRPFALAAAPTVRDLSRTVRRPGRDNDLVEFLRRQPAVDRIANRTAARNGAARPGALPASRTALRGATPQLGFFRPYTVDFVGWFDDFSSSGAYDALGSFSRAGLMLNQFSFTPAADALVPVPLGLRDSAAGALQFGRNNRCPGAVERKAPDGTNPFIPEPGFNCDPAQVPVGR